MRQGILSIAALAAVLSLAACGGGGSGTTTTGKQLTAAQYRAHIAKVKVEAAGAQAHIGAGLQSKTVADLKQKVDAFATATQQIGDEVAALNPPANAQAANAQLAAGLHAVSAATRTASAKIATMKTAQQAISYLEHSQGPAKGAQEINKALATLQKLGYTTGS